jgi:hypothetical protein
MRWLIVVFFLLHAFAHLVGVAASWRLGTRVPHKTTVLSGRVDLGGPGARVFGALWLLAALAFAAAAAGVWAAHPAWLPLTLGATALSLVLSVLAWPEARIGVGIDLAILAGLVVAHRTATLAGAVQ